MSRPGEGALKWTAGAALLLVALSTVIVRAEITAERYGLVECRRERLDCDRRREALRALLPTDLLDLAETLHTEEHDV